MTDIYFLILLNVLFFLIGFPISRLLPPSIFKFRGFTAPTFGYGITAVLATLLYKWGISIPFLFKIFVAICAVLMLFWLSVFYNKYIRNREIAGFYAANKRIIICYLVWIVGTGILLAPKLTGGNQFAVFQGNHWDTFGYLNSAVVYSQKSYNSILNSSTYDWIKNPLLAHAKGNLFCRPSVHILYSLVGQIMPHHYHTLYYTFLTFFFSQFILVTIFLLMNSFEDISPTLCGVASLAFPLGFWGQYIMDINAWSQISSLPILLLWVVLQVFLLGRYYSDGIGFSDAIKLLFILTIPFASGLYLYPENLFFHLPAITIIIGVSLIIRLRNNYNKSAIHIAIIALLAGISTGLLFSKGTFGLIVSQLNTVRSTEVDWWKYFLAFLQGQDFKALLQAIDFQAFTEGLHNFRNTSLLEVARRTSLLENISDFISGISGLYFLTPTGNQSVFVKICIRVSLTIFVSTLLWTGAVFVSRLFHPKLNTSFHEMKSPNIKLFGFIAIMLLSSLAYTLIFGTKIGLFLHDCALFLIIALIMSLIFARGITPFYSFSFTLTNSIAVIRSFAIIIFVMLLLILALLIGKHFWGAGKALTYVCPYIFIILIMAYFSLTAARANLLPKVILLAFMFAQISFGVIRIPSAASPNGIHYSFPYPSIQSVELKKKNDWEIDNICHYLSDSNSVLIDVRSLWLENYLMVYLYSIGKRYFTTNTVNTYFGRGHDIGYQKIPHEKLITITDRADRISTGNSPKQNDIHINKTLRLVKEK